MPDYLPWLRDIPSRARESLPLLRDWCALPTPSLDAVGLQRFAELLHREFAPRLDSCDLIPLDPWEILDERGEKMHRPLGPALRGFLRPEAPLRVFLGIHTDVVYGTVPVAPVPWREEETHLYAPGAADAKGGILVLLLALEAFARSPWAADLGLEILLNPDEEIGSPGAMPLLQEAAKRNRAGLLFEPALPDGGLVSARKGSGNFSALMRGRTGHAGRDAAMGRNAMHALAEFIVALVDFGAGHDGVIVNVGRIDGGGPVNRIADLGVARFNVRVENAEQIEFVREFLEVQRDLWKDREGYSLEFHGGFFSPPKVPDARGEALLAAALRCGEELGLKLKTAPSGGVCDGNKLAAAGLPNVDTLGPVGGGLHGNDEWVLLGSLGERASLAALMLMKMGAGEIALD